MAVHLRLSKPATAYCATVAENVVFYGIAFLFEFKRFGRLQTAAISIIAEFGPAEVFDFFLLRPTCLFLGLCWLGTAGIVAGKLAADLNFYGIAFLTRKWIRASIGKSQGQSAVGMNQDASPN